MKKLDKGDRIIFQKPGRKVILKIAKRVREWVDLSETEPKTDEMYAG